MRLKTFAPLLLIPALLVGMLVSAADFPQPNTSCSPNGSTLPAGQSSAATDDPQVPLWCYTLALGATTRVSGPNDWLDNFETGVVQRFTDGDSDYRVFAQDSEGRISTTSAITGDYFVADVVDTSAFRLSGGVFHSPARNFSFENGKLVVEADFAPGNFNTSGADVFYELDISPAAAPTGITVDPLYGYGAFGTVGAIGCRIQRQDEGGVPKAVSVCSQYDNTRRDAGGTDVVDRSSGPPGRVWETQGAGDSVIGTRNVTFDVTAAGFARMCADNAVDDFCFDRWRMELTRDSLRLYVNGALQRELTGMYAVNPVTGRDNRVPDSWFGATGVHVYFTDWINSGQHTPQRYFWDRLAINPHLPDGSSMPRSVADSFCPTMPLHTCAGGAPAATSTPGVGISATGTPVLVPTNTPVPPPPSSTPVAAATSAPTLVACQVRTQIKLNGVERPMSPYRNC